MSFEEKSKGDGILSCPCCGKTPYIYHQSCVEGGEASIICSKCGLAMTKYDDYNCYCAEAKAIKAWNKIYSGKRKVCKVVTRKDGDGFNDE